MYGNPETTPGGLALKFYSSVRLDIRRIESIKDGDKVIGNRTRVKVVKNKVAPPFQQAEFEMIFGAGISREGCLIDMGVNAEVVEKTGTWFLYKNERLGQGRENAKAFLRENKPLADDLEKAIRAKYLGNGNGAESNGKEEKAASPAKEPVKAVKAGKS
jgi:recombination protein RecA